MNTEMIELKPMRLTDVDVEDAYKYIEDDEWVLEQKLDGARVFLEMDRIGERSFHFEWRASGGGELKFSAATQHLPALEEELTRAFVNTQIRFIQLDGELIVEDGTFHIFDMPAVEDGSRLTTDYGSGYIVRKGKLLAIEVRVMHDLEKVNVVRTAIGREEKQKLWGQINEANVEGAVAKREDALYEFGTRTKDMVKLKLVKTADVIVTRVERTFKPDSTVLSHGKAELAVAIDPQEDPLPYVHQLTGRRASLADIEAWREGTKSQKAKSLGYEIEPRAYLPVGNASLIGKDLTIELGSVVEVAYLYFQEAMVQPRIIRKRERAEKLPDECRLDQFPTYSRERV